MTIVVIPKAKKMGYNGVQEIEGLNYEKRSKRTVHVKKKSGGRLVCEQ